MQKIFSVTLLIWVSSLLTLATTASARVCTQTDLTYAYTECSNNMRWRVQVPRPEIDCQLVTVAFPTQGLPCNFTCPPGNYLDISNSKCSQCSVGYYSLGSGMLFDTFYSLPTELVSTADVLGTPTNVSCKGAGWLPMGSFLAGKLTARCVLKLTLTVNLVTPGMLTFRYQYRLSEALFMFEVQNDRCESLGDESAVPWLEETEQGEIASRVTSLRMGINVLSWTLVAPQKMPLEPILEFGAGASVNKYAAQSLLAYNYPALLHSIEVTGLPFVYSCQPCHAGTYAAKPGQTRCSACPRDQFSPGGGAPCQNCPSDRFALPGSAECQARPVCRVFEPWQSPSCTAKTVATRLQYRWVQRQVCRESDQPDGVKLPAPGPEESCSKDPCYPGSELVESSATSTLLCRACPVGQYSTNSAGHCLPCPPNTQPQIELLVNNWLLMPLTVRVDQKKKLTSDLIGTTADFLSVSCLATDQDVGCPDGGWLATRSYLRTAAARGFSSRALQIRLARGFLTPTSDLFGRQNPAFAAKLRLEFETECRMLCQLSLYEYSTQGGSSLRRKWTNTQARQNFTYEIKSSGAVTFQLVFESVVSVDPIVREKATADHLKVFAVHVTNANGSGAVACTPCPMGLKDAKCIPCMPGHYYIDGEAHANNASSTAASAGGSQSPGTCLPCPAGTRVIRHPAVGVESCSPCPAGLIAVSGVACQLNNRPVDNNGRTYHLDRLLLPADAPGRGHLLASSGKMFALSGAQYSHLYNLSLTGQAVCQSNATKDFLRAMRGTEFADTMVTRVSNTYLCRSTLVPKSAANNKAGPGGNNGPTLLLPIELTDQLLNASFVERRKTDDRLMTEGFSDELAGIGSDLMTYDMDIWFGVSGDRGVSDACPNGHLARVTLRCDPNANINNNQLANSSDADRLLLPPACPDGTCDGCEFRLLLMSRRACPVCRFSDFDRVKGECFLGKQTIHLLPPKFCFEKDGSRPKRSERIVMCPIVTGPILVLLLTLIAIGLFSCLLACYCYRKNKSLQYKYTQLINASEGDATSGFGAPESCAVHEDEDDDEDKQIKVSGGSGSSGRAVYGRVKKAKNDKAALMESLGDVDL